MVTSGRSRISQRTNPAKNCMKMKEFGPRAAHVPWIRHWLRKAYYLASNLNLRPPPPPSYTLESCFIIILRYLISKFIAFSVQYAVTNLILLNILGGKERSEMCCFSNCFESRTNWLA